MQVLPKHASGHPDDNPLLKEMIIMGSGAVVGMLIMYTSLCKLAAHCKSGTEILSRDLGTVSCGVTALLVEVKWSFIQLNSTNTVLHGVAILVCFRVSGI